ncbi:MAG TPA: amyloid fiber anchoring/assembly protein TapA [Bacillota bacterium]|nr:amyloid fiber anchoring/assembly protein TapA [Bacillota bacterium]
MRSTRLRKFRQKHQWLIISLKTVLIFYIVLYSASYLTTDTVAYFGEKNVSNIMIAAGTWENEEDEDEEKDEEEREEGEKDSVQEEEEEDRSSLAFITPGDTTQSKCHMEVQVTNDGEGPMLSEGFYEVYYSEQKNPKIEGESVALGENEGIIPVLTKGEEISISFEPNKNGMYQFVLYGNDDIPEEEWIWSDVIEIECLKEAEKTEEEEKQEEPTNETDELIIDKEEEGEMGDDGEESTTEENKDMPSIEDDEDVGEDETEENTKVDE